jgi:predicted RNase H-like HicB family nuclease
MLVRKKKLSRKILEYTAVFEPAEEGGYVVSVPVLPGCVTQGENFEEAVFMVRDAIKGYLSVLEEQEDEVPLENPAMVIARVAVAEA